MKNLGQAYNQRQRSNLHPGPKIYGIPLSDTVDAYVSGGTAATFTAPSGANFVNFSATVDFYVNEDATAASPGASITDGTASELNPVTRRVPTDGTFSIFAATGGVVTLSWFGDGDA